MNEVAEATTHVHVPPSLIWWILLGILSVVWAGLLFWTKRWINKRDQMEADWEKKGGVVTREDYFKWCGENQAKCPTCILMRRVDDWRNGMTLEGGPLLKAEHSELCKEVMGIVTEKLCAEFEHHRTLMAAELKLIRGEIALTKSDISKEVLTGINAMKKELLQEMSDVEKRSR